MIHIPQLGIPLPQEVPVAVRNIGIMLFVGFLPQVPLVSGYGTCGR